MEKNATVIVRFIREWVTALCQERAFFAEVVTGGHIKIGDEVVMEQVKSDRPFSAAVITLSDKGSVGEREDKSGPMIVEMLKDAGYDIKRNDFITG